MKSGMNPARIQCPDIVSTGRCNASGCPYSHVKVQNNVSAAEISSQKSLSATGRNGQYTGTSKGANAIPVAKGQLPSFLQNLKQPSSVTPGYVSASRPVEAAPVLRGMDGQSMGAQAVSAYRLNRVSTSRPVDTELHAPAAPVRPEVFSSRDDELTRLRKIKESKIQEMKKLDEEIANLSPNSASTETLQFASIEIAKVQEFTQLYQGMVGDEIRTKLKSMMDKIESTLLLDSNALATYSAQQCVIVEEMKKMFKALNANVSKLGVDFRMKAKEIREATHTQATLIPQPTQPTHTPQYIQPTQPPQNTQPAGPVYRRAGLTPAPVPTLSSSTAQFRIKTVYHGEGASSISVPVGEIVVPMSKPDNGFIYVQRTSDGKCGWIPVHVIES